MSGVEKDEANIGDYRYPKGTFAPLYLALAGYLIQTQFKLWPGSNGIHDYRQKKSEFDECYAGIFLFIDVMSFVFHLTP